MKEAGALEVKGTAFLARKVMLEHERGVAAFASVLGKLSRADQAVFSRPILATTRIPVDAFLRLNDAIVDELYGGDELSYFGFGKQSASWSLTQGPYKHLVQSRSVAEFVASAPTLYRNYFTAGDAKGVLDDGVVRLRLFGIGSSHRHVYFEYAIMGYFEHGLRLVSGRDVRMSALQGFSKGDNEVLYEFVLV